MHGELGNAAFQLLVDLDGKGLALFSKQFFSVGVVHTNISAAA
ncbi:hypothetical protein [Arthrobacter sp. SAFR-044]